MVELEKPSASRAEVPGDAQAEPQVLAMLAHELRNPLAPIRNGTELLRSICSDPRQLQVVEMISRQVVHLTHLLDDLLDAARLQRGLLTIKKQTVDVAAIIEQALEAVRPAIDARKQNLLVSLPATSVRMHCDPVRLVQVLQNLLDNANRFSEDGGAISVRAEVADRQLVFEVADNGTGIEPSLLPRLFNMFAQGEQPLQRPKGGLGLGLAIARNLVEMHGGAIDARSAGLGQGSRFTVRLPLEEPPAESNVARGADSVKAVSYRILIIEDNDIVAMSLEQYLSHRGHEVMTAGSGEIGLTVAEQFRPHAVILDIGLPGMNGFEVARRLRSAASSAGTVLIAVSGYSPEMVRGADTSLFARYLSKPAFPGTILSTIEETLKEADGAAAAGHDDSTSGT